MEKLKRPFYTVIVPARNEADYILATLLSVKKQKTSKDFDILVIDNGSVDNTADICKSAGYKVVHEPVAGLPKARETGRQNAKGQYLIYIDADTTMPENYLETMADAIDQYPDAVALSNGFNFYDGSVAQNFIIAGYFKLIYPLQSFILWLIGSSKQVIGGSFVVKAEALENIGGFNTDIEFFGEDTEISKRLGKLGKIVFTKKVRVATSARRFKIDGTVITSFVYVKNYLSMTLFNRRSDNGLLRQATKLIFLAEACT